MARLSKVGEAIADLAHIRRLTLTLQMISAPA